MQWRDLVKYPHLVSLRTVNLLDTLHTVIPCPGIVPDEFFGRDLHLCSWVRQGFTAGLITWQEVDCFYIDVSPHI
jgi:hypothetical protein